MIYVAVTRTYILYCNAAVKQYISLQRNPISGFAFLGVDEGGVDLGGFDAFVGEHLGDCVDIRAECDLKRGKGVSEAVECNVLPYPRSLYPGI